MKIGNLTLIHETYDDDPSYHYFAARLYKTPKTWFLFELVTRRKIYGEDKKSLFNKIFKFQLFAQPFGVHKVDAQFVTTTAGLLTVAGIIGLLIII